MRLADLIPILQFAIGPVILFSGVGLLSRSMNNRLCRTIDRSRLLIEKRNQASDALQRSRLDQQLALLWRRAKILRTAISLAALGVLLDALLIVVLFVSAVWKLEEAVAVITLFVGCLLSIVASVGFFLRDVNLSLHALAMDMHPTETGQI
jgi:hypothetical protein